MEEFIHCVSLLFACFASSFRSIHAQGHVPCRRVEPAYQHRVPGQTLRLPRSFREDLLCHVLRRVNVTVHQPQRGRIDQVHMPPSQFGKSHFRLCRGILA